MCTYISGPYVMLYPYVIPLSHTPKLYPYVVLYPYVIFL